METMIDLLTTQIEDINADEQRLEGSLDFVGQSMESILLTRKDTFKEQITRAYAEKDDVLNEYKIRVEKMEDRDQDYDRVCSERDALLAHNQALIEELNAIKSQNKQTKAIMQESLESVAF